LITWAVRSVGAVEQSLGAKSRLLGARRLVVMVHNTI
jgi:hypothetical protein